MKKFISMLTYLLVGMFMVVGFSACTEGDPEEKIVEVPVKTKLVGTWNASATSGTSKIAITYVFKADGTGVERTEYMSGSTSSSTYNRKFEYTYNEESGRLILRIEGQSLLEVYEVTITGNILMMEDSEHSVLTLTKK